MAEGGEFGHYDPELDFLIDNDDEYEDYQEEEVDTTRPFEPGAASTPYHGGEQHEMQTMMHERPGTSYEETPLLSAQSQIQQSWDALTRVFPDASAADIETSYDIKTRRLQVKMRGAGKKLYDLFIKDRITGRPKVNPRLSKEIVRSLG